MMRCVEYWKPRSALTWSTALRFRAAFAFISWRHWQSPWASMFRESYFSWFWSVSALPLHTCIFVSVFFPIFVTDFTFPARQSVRSQLSAAGLWSQITRVLFLDGWSGS